MILRGLLILSLIIGGLISAGHVLDMVMAGDYRLIVIARMKGTTESRPLLRVEPHATLQNCEIAGEAAIDKLANNDRTVNFFCVQSNQPYINDRDQVTGSAGECVGKCRPATTSENRRTIYSGGGRQVEFGTAELCSQFREYVIRRQNIRGVCI